MTLDARFREEKVAYRIKLEFDNSKLGGRRSLVWNPAEAKDYTARLRRVGRIQHTTEATLHSYETSDLELEMENIPTTPGSFGFWDTDPADAGFDLTPLYEILCRVSISVQEAAGTWTAFQPVFTGVVTDVETSNVESNARLRILGVPTYLTDQDASDVKNVDSHYQQISINRAVRLLLTQKDRWVPLYAPDVAGTVTAVTSSPNTISVQRTGELWGQDDTGAHPDGVLAGYVVIIESGAAAGNVYVIQSNTGGATNTAVCTVEGDPGTDGVVATDTVTVTGYCWPYLTSELAGFDIDPVYKIPTHDGRRVVSAYGRPPEDSSLGIGRAVAWDSADGVLWIGVENQIYLYDPVADTYELYVTLTPSDYLFRWAFYDPITNYTWLCAWIDNRVLGRPDTPALFRVRRSMSHPVVWTNFNAPMSLSGVYPGNKQWRRSWQSMSTPTTHWGQIGHTGVGGPDPSDPNMPNPFPHTIHEFGELANPGDGSWYFGRSDTPYSPAAAAEESPWPSGDPWVFTSIAKTKELNAVDFVAEQFVGGRYVWCYAVNDGVPYIWRFTWHQPGSPDPEYFKLVRHRLDIPNGAPEEVFTWAPNRRVPVAIWQAADGSAMYIAANNYADTLTTNEGYRLRVWKITTNPIDVTFLWESTADHLASTLLFVDASDGDGLNGIACLCAMLNPGYSGGTTTPWHQKWLLVKNVQDPNFWAGIEDGSNILYVSERAFGHFYNASTAVGGDGRVWFMEYGTNRLWHGFNGTVGYASKLATVAGDRTLASNLTIRHDTNSVFGISAGDWLDLDPNATPPGKYYLWSFAHYHAPRIPLFALRGLSRKRALDQIAELADYVAAWKSTGTISFKRREVVSPADWPLADDATFARIRKRRTRKETWSRVEATPYETVLEPPRVRFFPSIQDENGDAIQEEIFNGAIHVRQTDTLTKRLKLICVWGNRRTYQTQDSPYEVTRTRWQVYNPSANPQFYGQGSALGYPGAWWNPGEHNVWVRFEDPIDLAPEDRRGFAPGDVIEIECPGLVARPVESGIVYAQDAAAHSAFRSRTYPISNQLLPPEPALDLCNIYLAAYKDDRLELVADSELFPSYEALQTLSIASAPRLNLASLTTFIRTVEHDAMPAAVDELPQDGRAPQTQLVLREWANQPEPVVGDMPDPVPPPAEPPEFDTDQLLLLWSYPLPEPIYSTVEIQKTENQAGSDPTERLVCVCWDGGIRILNPDGSLRALFNPNAANAYGTPLCIPNPLSANAGDYYPVWGSHDGSLRCMTPTLSSVLWSVLNWYDREAIPPPQSNWVFWQHSGSWGQRDVNASRKGAVFGICFDGRLYQIRANLGLITFPNGWERDFSGGGSVETLLHIPPCMVDTDETGWRAAVTPVRNMVQVIRNENNFLWGYTVDTDVSPIAGADVNGDGHVEIIFVAGIMAATLQYRLIVLDRLGNFLRSQNVDDECAVQPLVMDIDGDGFKEIIFPTLSGTVYCFRLLASGLYLVWQRNLVTTAIISQPCLLDVDGDGRREVLIGTLQGVMYVLRGSDGATLQIVNMPAGLRIEGGITGGDIDGDGFVEVVVPVSDAQTIFVFRGGPTYPNNWSRRDGWDLYRSGEIAPGEAEPAYDYFP